MKLNSNYQENLEIIVYVKFYKEGQNKKNSFFL